MSSVLSSLPGIFAAYKNWISENPSQASDYETTAKWISYFIAGKINNSQLLSELVYCLSNLLVFCNDRIISSSLKIDHPAEGSKLKLWLTVVEYCEVLFEFSSHRLWGSRGKWLVIIAVQIFKCVSRLILIHCYKEPIIQNPPLPCLNRVQLAQRGKAGHSMHDIAQAQRDSIFFKLKSGRIVRKVEASPPLGLRSWKPVQHEADDCGQTVEQALAGRQLLAESLYIVKPVAHLASLACFGGKSWKPWLLALLLDVTSLQLYASCKHTKLNGLTAKQKLQVSKRTWVLLMYVLRSPFYERNSQDPIKAFLGALGRNVPLAKLICGPLAQYLPLYQATYFYMWST